MEQPLPQIIHFGREVCNDLEQAERREWWLANGLGGYAAGTVAGTLTRRYHGLLVAPLSPNQGRRLLFAKADTTLVLDDRRIPLHTNRWTGGAIEPQGYLYLESFHLEGRLPVWRYALGDLRLEARIWMEMGAHSTYLAWRLLAEPGNGIHPRLQVRLLIDRHDHHGQTLPADFEPAIEASEHSLRVRLVEDESPLHFHSRCGRFLADNTWIERFHLREEHLRGLPDTDNHLCAGTLDLPLYSGEWVGLVASLEPQLAPYQGESLRRRLHQDASLLRMAKVQNACLADAPPWIDQLVLAACDFLIVRPGPDRNKRSGVIAGYPWFGEWGRDTFIALPGLTLPTHRPKEARQMLTAWAALLDDGHLPNHLPEGGDAPRYNSADAALWYIEAWRAYLEVSHDWETLRVHWSALVSIVEGCKRGTRHGIGFDQSDGLLTCGTAETQLTWMDARVDGSPITPRFGKPVEINALWYNALMSLAGIASRINEDPAPFERLAGQAQAGFRRFVRDDGLGLYDVLDGSPTEIGRMRPNQILAVSLQHSPLESVDQARVVATVGERLATSCGLRTLAPTDPDYRPRYEGGVSQRDAAYHQGPAWAWLLPHYALAIYRVTGDAAYAQSLLEPFAAHLHDAGLGTLSELFDAEPPHMPRGAPAQAWSVATVLDAWCTLERAKRASIRHG